MTHLKRQNIPKSWPIPRKGTTFVVKSNFGFSKAMPLLVVMRDLLKIAGNRKEVKKAIYSKNILINSRQARDEKEGIQLFDVVTIVPSKENYRISLSEKGKFVIEKISESEAGKKVSKIIGKKILKGKKVQLNLSDGRNFLSDIKCNINDSVLINLKSKKIEKILALKENANAFVFAGKHAGEKGKIEKIKAERKMASIKSNKGKINVLIKQFMVVE